MIAYLQKFIANVGNMELANALLHAKLGIKVKKQTLCDRESVYIYNYTHKSPINHPISNECTGIILDKAGSVVSKGPNRVFNVADAAHKIVWGRKTIAEELIPGSRITIFKRNDKWHIQTRNNVNGTEYADNHSHDTIAEQVIDYIETVYSRGGLSDKGFYPFCDFVENDCYTFIYSPDALYNKLYLISIYSRNNDMFYAHLALHTICKRYGFCHPVRHIISNISDLVHIMKQKEFSQFDLGYIIRDNTGAGLSVLRGKNISVKEKKFKIVDVVRSILANKTKNLGEAYPCHKSLIQVLINTRCDIEAFFRKALNGTTDLNSKEFSTRYKKHHLYSYLLALKMCDLETVEEAVRSITPVKFVAVAKHKYLTAYEAAIEESKTMQGEGNAKNKGRMVG